VHGIIFIAGAKVSMVVQNWRWYFWLKTHAAKFGTDRSVDLWAFQTHFSAFHCWIFLVPVCW